MQPSNISVKTQNFRAIKNADIDIDGISMVAGENGCGKSTLSKSLYYLFNTISNYEKLVKQELISELSDMFLLFDILAHDIVVNNRSQTTKITSQVRTLRRVIDTHQLEEAHVYWLSLINEIQILYTEVINEVMNTYQVTFNEAPAGMENRRLNRIVQEELGEEFNFDSLENTLSTFKEIKDIVSKKFVSFENKIYSRPTSLFLQKLSSEFSSSRMPDVFEVKEYDEIIFSKDVETLAIPFSIQRAIYIDTPMMISIKDSKNSHWNDLNTLLYKEPNRNGLSTKTISEIIDGDVEYTDDLFEDQLTFHRKDGAVFDLLDVATGIKSFSVIQLLLKNGYINDKTLLIIDEPESNLHPQWIVEYARMVVLLHKEIGVKFFLASHNPDMVSAIRYIAEKEGVLDSTNFYLAEKANEYQYKYTPLGHEIAPIFESFNIALDRINQYGI